MRKIKSRFSDTKATSDKKTEQRRQQQGGLSDDQLKLLAEAGFGVIQTATFVPSYFPGLSFMAAPPVEEGANVRFRSKIYIAKEGDHTVSKTNFIRFVEDTFRVVVRENENATVKHEDVACMVAAYTLSYFAAVDCIDDLFPFVVPKSSIPNTDAFDDLRAECAWGVYHFLKSNIEPACPCASHVAFLRQLWLIYTGWANSPLNKKYAPHFAGELPTPAPRSTTLH